MISELILNNRSYRRFFEEKAVELETLKELVDLARLSASAANLQSLKYLLSSDLKRNALIFPNLAWAAYLKDWPGRVPGRGHPPISSFSGTLRYARRLDATMEYLPRVYCWVLRKRV